MNFKFAVLACFVISVVLPPAAAVAQTAVTPPAKQSDAKSDQSGDMTSGEIQKVEKDTGRLTIKHGEIKNLGMPAMTMTFATKDKSMADKVKPGDKIRFKAVNENGKFIVTEIAQDK
jgi:Cu/Ag efflux protein CusF